MHRTWFAIVVAMLTAPLPAGISSVESAKPPAAPGRATHEPAGNAASLSDLAPAAQAQISAVLGRDAASYHAAPQPDGFRVENAEHGLAADFTRAGVQVRAATASWGLSLAGYGYGDQPPAATAVAPHAAANRIEYRRGALTEWYVNGPLGVEQGFTLAAPPGKSAGEPLTLRFELSGNVIAVADPNGTDLTLTRPDGAPALRYRGLTAYDATGRELRAWIQLEDDRLSLRVDDTDARYPVVVDPFIEQAKLTAPDGAAGDRFGQRVAVSGDTIVVGAPEHDIGATTNQGSTYVFVKPLGGWSEPITEQAKLIASDGAISDGFGFSVAIDGDTIVVGAPFDDVEGGFGLEADHGSAYVFVKPIGGWSGMLTENAKLTTNAGPGDLFGRSVAVSGDTVVVGTPESGCARFGDVGALRQGQALVFVKPALGWTGTHFPNAQLCASDGDTGDQFGISVAISGDTILAGAWLDDTATRNDDRGSARVFVRPASGWSGNLIENARLTASDAGDGDRFGNSVAMSGDTIVVGAFLDDTIGRTDHGSAYVFVKPATAWSNGTENAKLTASDGATNDQFGQAVGVSGDTIVVGARLHDIGSNADQGSVYTFVKPPGGWSPESPDLGGDPDLEQTAKLTASDGAAGDSFGVSLALSGETLVVGALFDDIGANVDQGSVYVFVSDPRPATLTLTPEAAENAVGTTHTVMATVKDGNAQPVANVIVRFDVAGSVTESGACTTALDGQCAFTYQGPTAPGSDAIAAFADADGDGVQDVDEPGGTAAKTWVAGAPASVVLAPATATNPVGTMHTVRALVADTFGNPVPDIAVHFAVTGSVSAAGACTTDMNGVCDFAYQGPTRPGEDGIAAFADTDGDAAHDPDEPSGAAMKTWVPGPPATVTVMPPDDTNTVSTEHCVTATVTDAFGNATPGVSVRFAVSGSVTANGSDTTDTNGEAAFCYMGPDLPGADEITAHADTDGDGIVDEGEPVGTATKSWILPEATPGHVTGGGQAPAESGSDHIAFGFSAKSDDGELKGNCNVVDRAADVHFKCVDVLSLVRDGARATIFGNGTINGVQTTYRIDVEDVAEPGRETDTFTIRTESGYVAGGTLKGGNIQVR